MAQRAVPTEAIERRIADIDERLGSMVELQRERALLLSLLDSAIEVAPPEELAPEEAATLTGKILDAITQYPDLTSAGVARYLGATGIEANVKVIQTIIGQHVKKGAVLRSPDARLRMRT